MIPELHLLKPSGRGAHGNAPSQAEDELRMTASDRGLQFRPQPRQAYGLAEEAGRHAIARGLEQ